MIGEWGLALFSLRCSALSSKYRDFSLLSVLEFGICKMDYGQLCLLVD